MTSIQQNATVLWNRRTGLQCFHMGLACSRGYDGAQPGQFVMLHLKERHPSLLRRPFSIFDLIGSPDRPEGVELLYKVVGPGTARLSQLRKDDTLDLLGPLGHGFRIRSEGPFYLAAGGIGVAPIHFLARRMQSLKIDTGKCQAFIGSQSRDDLLCQEAFLDMGMPVAVTTIDGTAGDQCLITDPLEAAIAARKPQAVFACGPIGMLQCVAGIVSRFHVDCQVSIETLMGCGLGACLGCAVQGRGSEGGYLHACVHGPVFDAADLDWTALGGE